MCTKEDYIKFFLEQDNPFPGRAKKNHHSNNRFTNFQPKKTINNDPDGYYAILELCPDTSEDGIESLLKKQYYKLSLKNHPDRAGGDETKFKELHNAYEFLSDPDNRRAYKYKDIGHTFGN